MAIMHSCFIVGKAGSRGVFPLIRMFFSHSRRGDGDREVLLSTRPEGVHSICLPIHDHKRRHTLTTLGAKGLLKANVRTSCTLTDTTVVATPSPSRTLFRPHQKTPGRGVIIRLLYVGERRSRAGLCNGMLSRVVRERVTVISGVE